MKKTIFAFLSIFCLAGTAAAQGWVPLTSGTTARLYYLSLIGSDTIYASGGTAIRSTDGGATWDSLTNMPSYKGVRMTSALVQFVDDSTGFLCGSADTVYKTTNGGQTWIPGPATGIPGGFPPIAMVFKTRYFGCIDDGFGRTSRTTDGGATWQMAEEAVGFNCMAFADTLHGYGMGKDQPWLHDPTRPYAAGFASTTDGAATIWIPSYAGPSVDGKHTGVTSDVWGIAAINADTIISVGLQIGRTFDGGADWDTVPYPGADYFNSLNAVFFPDPLHGTAVGTSGWIYHTTDGGTTWQKQNSGITGTTFLNEVRFIDSLTGYAVGDEGIILKTTNGGLAWVNISPLSDNLIKGTIFPQPARENTSLAYNLPETQHVSLSIQNVTGATVLPVLAGSLQTDGIQTVKINTGSLASGTYTYVLSTEKYYSTGKIEVIH